jgi:general secretion pathway protein M
MQSILSKLNKLNKREKLAIIGAGICIGLFIILQFMIFPVFDKRERLHRSLTAAKSALTEMVQLKAEYQAISLEAEKAKARIGQRDKQFTLFSFLDDLAGQTGVKDRIVYMKPSTSANKNSPLQVSIVEMKLREVTVEQLTALLYRIEMSKNMVTVKRLSISKEEKQEGVVDSILQVETFQL